MAQVGTPIVQASSKVFAEVQHSLAGVRGWICLGDEVSLEQWENAWTDGIMPTMNSFKKQTYLLEKVGIQDLIDKLFLLLVELHESQWWINNIAQTPGNEPAKVSFLFEVEPITRTLESIIREMMLKAKYEEDILSRENFLILLNIEYLYSFANNYLDKIIFQDAIYKENNFWNSWDELLVGIQGMNIKNNKQSIEWNQLIFFLKKEAKAYKRFAKNAIKLKKSKKNNIVEYLISSEIIPLTSQVIEVLRNISLKTNLFLKTEAIEASRATIKIIALMVILVVSMIFIAFKISTHRAYSLTQPIYQLSVLAKDFALGKLDKDIPVISDDEIGELTQSFNFMRKSIYKAQFKLKKANLSLSKRVQKRTAQLNTINENLQLEINRHLQTQIELVNSKDQFQKIFKNSPVVITLSLSENGLYLDVNDSFVKILGWQPEEVIGRTSTEIGLWPEAQDRLDLMKAYSKDGFIRDYEMTAITKYNKLVNFIISIEAVQIGNQKCFVTVAIDITKRKIAEKKISESLMEKEILLSEIHHRVKNNMQVIISLLRLQSKQIQNKKFAVLLKKSENRILSMALVHEQLYQSKDFSNINFCDYISRLTNDLFISNGIDTKKINLNIKCVDVFLELENAIPCGLIINELIANCLKYAFVKQEKGKIDIIVSKECKDEFKLIIQDNGIGIPEYSDLQKTKSMGLQLVKVLAQETLEGTMQIDRTHGTRFEFEFKKNQYRQRI